MSTWSGGRAWACYTKGKVFVLPPRTAGHVTRRITVAPQPTYHGAPCIPRTKYQ